MVYVHEIDIVQDIGKMCSINDVSCVNNWYRDWSDGSVKRCWYNKNSASVNVKWTTPQKNGTALIVVLILCVVSTIMCFISLFYAIRDMYRCWKNNDKNGDVDNEQDQEYDEDKDSYNSYDIYSLSYSDTSYEYDT
jgi:hypothetical protein